jgi:hypothetical protein
LFLTLRSRLTRIAFRVNRHKSGEYHNDENLIKGGTSIPLEYSAALWSP